ncbi:hypothetical protein K458DRAFT_483823 [Lentithecium fluviatile CBS 122367]|uniref:Uncharacterized protein n=1 Tax=Lentithecium fluviatile CBS 122367 TaxID=1168545 RepID=A0A6G1JJ36_9PLEO|nr:hypothetical protein K458DRAFT_483823 [Lentithecium fluviatile CBS 122367]
MSSSAATPTDTKDSNVDRRKSLGKYVKRMSSVFRREKSDKGKSKSSPLASGAPATPATVGEKKEATPASAATSGPAATPKRADPVTKELNRSALQQERARALFAKYGLTLESHEWITTPSQPISVQRVEKPIRMRVHRTCHHCSTTFGADKICSKCEHKRCKKCPRYPKKRTPGDKGKEREKEGPVAPKKKKLLTITTKSGGELAYQPAKQRVRRTCHKCDALFIPPTATICEQCRHLRCIKCPRDPAKLSKWPNGYPGDVDPDSEAELERALEQARRIWRKPRTRVRWECEECHSLFLEGSPQCPGCGHARCEKCVRKPIKKIKTEQNFDPEVVKAVEAKLRALHVEEDQRRSASPEAV